MKRKRTETRKFQRSIHKMFFNITYVHSMKRGAFTEQTLRADSYGLQVFGNWKQRWFTELRRDRPGRSSRTRTVAVSRNVEGPLRVA